MFLHIRHSLVVQQYACFAEWLYYYRTAQNMSVHHWSIQSILLYEENVLYKYINVVMVLTQDPRFHLVNSLPLLRKESHPSCIKGNTRSVLCTSTWSQRRWSLRRGVLKAFSRKQKLKQNMAGEHVRKTQDTCMGSVELKCADFCCKFCCNFYGLCKPPMQNK